MSSTGVKDIVECAVSHYCAKEKKLRCATCEVGFKFVVEDPIQLICGHCICAKCKLIDSNNNFECQNHKDPVQSPYGLESIIGKELITTKLKELFNNTLETFEKTADLLESILLGLLSFIKKSLSFVFVFFSNSG